MRTKTSKINLFQASLMFFLSQLLHKHNSTPLTPSYFNNKLVAQQSSRVETHDQNNSYNKNQYLLHWKHTNKRTLNQNIDC